MNDRIIAGVDLSEFVEEWLELVESDRAAGIPLRSELGAPVRTSPYFLAMNIGPQASNDDASDEVMLFFAVLFTYQLHKFPGMSPTWEGAAAHVDRAFAFARDLGETQMATDLLQDVVSRVAEDSFPWPAKWKEDTARVAAHDREMAWLDQREVKAAALLDRSVTFDSLFLGPVS